LNNGACPKKRSYPEIFYCIEYTFTFWSFEQLPLALKNRGGPEFTVLNIYFALCRVFEQLALALEFFTVLNYFLSFRILATGACPEKNRVALKIFTIWNTLYIHNF